jgi:hypothetical protein
VRRSRGPSQSQLAAEPPGLENQNTRPSDASAAHPGLGGLLQQAFDVFEVILARRARERNAGRVLCGRQV